MELIRAEGGNLDFESQIRLLDQLTDLARDVYTCIESTHFPDHAFWIADHVVMPREGTVVTDGCPSIVTNEKSVCGLYHTESGIVEVSGRAKTCLPRSIVSNGRRRLRGED